MRRHVRLGGMALVGAVGMASAMAIGAGANDVAACVSQSGEVTPTGRTGKCVAGQSAITISGDAFKKGRRGTITINGVAFKKSARGNTITINGTAFKGSRGRTITINSNTFKTGTLPNTITINGNSFRTGTLPNTITINGNSFRSSGNTLTINGTQFGPGQALSQGPPGPPGPAGSVPAGKAPVEVAGPVQVGSGASGRLAALDFTASEPRRVQLVGGFNALCNPCSGEAVTPAWELRLDGSAAAAVQRRLVPLADGQAAGASVSEIVVTPAGCGPCTYSLSLAVPESGAGIPRTVSASAIRLGLVDLGPVG